MASSSDFMSNDPVEPDHLQSVRAASEKSSDTMDKVKVEPKCLLMSPGAASECPPYSMDGVKVEPQHPLQKAGATSESLQNVIESASFPNTKENSKSKHPRQASISGHPQEKKPCPNNTKKKEKRGENSLQGPQHNN